MVIVNFRPVISFSLALTSTVEELITGALLPKINESLPQKEQYRLVLACLKIWLLIFKTFWFPYGDRGCHWRTFFCPNLHSLLFGCSSESSCLNKSELVLLFAILCYFVVFSFSIYIRRFYRKFFLLYRRAYQCTEVISLASDEMCLAMLNNDKTSEIITDFFRIAKLNNLLVSFYAKVITHLLDRQCDKVSTMWLFSFRIIVVMQFCAIHSSLLIIYLLLLCPHCWIRFIWLFNFYWRGSSDLVVWKQLVIKCNLIS